MVIGTYLRAESLWDVLDKSKGENAYGGCHRGQAVNVASYEVIIDISLKRVFDLQCIIGC